MKIWSRDALLPRLIVEVGAVAEVGRHFCVATYGAEGEDPLPFTIYLIFDDLDAYVESGVIFEEDGLAQKRCREAAELLQPT